MARGHLRVLLTVSPLPLPLLPWGRIGDGRRGGHKRSGKKVGVLKGWEVGEIEGNGQYSAITKGLKGES